MDNSNISLAQLEENLIGEKDKSKSGQGVTYPVLTYSKKYKRFYLNTHLVELLKLKDGDRFAIYPHTDGKLYAVNHPGGMKISTSGTGSVNFCCQKLPSLFIKASPEFDKHAKIMIRISLTPIKVDKYSLYEVELIEKHPH